MSAFDLLTLPLHGTRLIEAGAGTGKTYSIEGLFLRLILDAGLAIDQILVLTFTVAATEELRRRIRNRLNALRNALAAPSGEVDDPLVSALAGRCDNPRRALRCIDDALLDFDRAAIYTIHGFCQRLLTEHAFETGSLFDFELAVDSSPLIMESAADFWRRRLYDVPPELAAFFFEQQMTGPDRLADLYGRLQRPGDLTVCGALSDPPPLERLDAFRRRYAALRTEWPRAREAVATELMTPALKVRPYGRLERAASGKQDSPRKAKVRALCRAMDRYLDADNVGFPPFTEVRQLTVESLTKATRKGASPPDHAFFHACQALADAESALRADMARYLLWFKTDFVVTAAKHLAEHKTRKNVLFYDDLLTRTRDALRRGRGLGKAARKRYRAALVDEFQDTDPVQYEIFTRLFRNKNSVLFMIGDPKQAIYGFRGADVFSYLAAAGDADARYSLVQNWRSVPALVEAVNALFAAAPRPFVLEGIDFAPARPALGADGDRGGKGALEIWQISGRADGRMLPKQDASRLLIRCVADEIGRLRSAGRPASQIAVLVRTNRQAREIKATLSERGIPAVLYSAGSVFASEEAEQLHILLGGVCEDNDTGRLRAAMTTDLIGISAADLGEGESDPEWWSQRAAPFAEDGRVWHQRGFMRMFQGLMHREGIQSRLLHHPDGERRLTNLLHLVELCHRAAVEEALGPAALVKWLARRRESAGTGADEEQIRLESDARAVQVVTVHRSKGLEFPVVFVPFAWESGAMRLPGELVFHDPDAANRLTLDLGGGDRKKSERLARTETLAEELRLLYVAVTRAKERCYLAWGRINQVETAPLTYLLHGGPVAADPDPARALSAVMKDLDETAFFAPLAPLVAAAGGSIQVRAVDPASMSPPGPAEESSPALLLNARRFSARIDRTWRVASYSLLAADHRGAAAPEAPDRDRIGPAPPGHPEGSVALPERADILDFPGGTRAGNFFHELLENAPFRPEATDQRRRLTARLLRRHRYDDRWLDAVTLGIERVLSTPLTEGDSQLILSSVRNEQRLHEVSFFFPLRRIDSRKLGGLLPGLPTAGERLRFSPVQGYLKGYIDLVFQHGGRYFLVDWKSNRIGPAAADYHRSALGRVMTEAHYHLQYALYSLALDLYLRQRDPAYRFDSGFGGVFYLFLRGMRPERGAEWGVFFDRPERALITRLRDALVAHEGIDIGRNHAHS